MRYGKLKGRLLFTFRVGIALGVAAAAGILYTPTTATAQDAAGAAASAPTDCYVIDEECVPFTAIDENTTVFLAFAQDLSATGFTDFTQYQAYVLANYNMSIELVDGRVVIVEPDGGAKVAAPSNFAFFYNRGNFTGSAFAVSTPDVVNNLNNLRYPGGGTWNNRISSVSTRNGGSAGAILCSRVGCATSPGFFIVLPPDSDIQLTGGLNNSASAVAVP